MFDDKEPQDIFAGTDKAPAPAPAATPASGVAAPAPTSQAPIPPGPAAQTAAPQPRYEVPPSNKLSIKTLFLIFLALLLIGGAAYAAYVFVLAPSPAVILPEPTVPEEETPALPTPDEEVPEEVPTEPEPSLEVDAALLDSDGDGLTDAEELEAGTSATTADTDGDGLGDREEVKVYGTDPLRTDTDNDTYLDGAEVQGGYNPNGAGKLLEIPSP